MILNRNNLKQMMKNLIKFKRKSFFLVITMCLAEIFGMTGYNLWPAKIPDFQESWNLSSTSVGWIGGSYFLGYVIAIWPLSSLTDRVDPKKIYLLFFVNCCYISTRICHNFPRVLDSNNLAYTSGNWISRYLHART